MTSNSKIPKFQNSKIPKFQNSKVKTLLFNTALKVSKKYLQVKYNNIYNDNYFMWIVSN